MRRLSGDDNAPPVINLQTNFGGGKTHSMLALWHVAAGLPVGDFPQDTQDLLTANGYSGTKVNRVAIVGNHFSPSGDDQGRRHPRQHHLGRAGLAARRPRGLRATSPRPTPDRTHPGEALHELLAKYAPAVILIDEWVAYARSLVGRDDLAGGTFDDQFTFAQSLTEAAKGTSGVLLVISIPASESGDDADKIVAGNAEEVGGANGLEALKRLQNVVRRVADQWRPASSAEAYQIVKQRLFKQPDAAALASIGATARAYVEMYRKYTDDFPRESRDTAYEDRIKRTYPIHPELFDRLYEEWSSLERFQRTRGVLRLMSTVIHALWAGEDASPLIMPGSIPLATANVNAELTQYLQDSWKAIIDADVDGPNSEPARIDKEKPLFGQRVTHQTACPHGVLRRRPTIASGSAHKGLETQRVFLGTAMPGDVPGNFHAALTQLGDRATYFYSGSGKYWYDLQANITRTAKDQAERLHKEDVWAEIVRRLQSQARTRGDFAGVHVCPETNADIPDTDEARLVILHPKVAHKRGADSAAKDFAQKATEHRGSANRTNRNMLVYLAADEARLEELDTATRDYLGWTHVLDNEADLDLTQNQKNQATQRQTQADQTVTSRLLQTFTWALVPAQPDPGAPFVIRETKVEGQSESLAERVSRRLGNDGDLSTRQAAATIRLAISKVPQIWKDGHVSLGALWGAVLPVPLHAAAARPQRARRRHRRHADALADRRLRPGHRLRRVRRSLHRSVDSRGQGRSTRRNRLAPARPPRHRRQAARSGTACSPRHAVASRRGTRQPSTSSPTRSTRRPITAIQDPVLRRQDTQLRQDRARLQERRRRGHRPPPRRRHRPRREDRDRGHQAHRLRRKPGPHGLRERPDAEVRPVGLRGELAKLAKNNQYPVHREKMMRLARAEPEYIDQVPRRAAYEAAHPDVTITFHGPH